MLLAGVDIGTLTCRLLIARVLPDGRLREVEADRRILRLGERLEETGNLSPAAISRVLETLRDWRRRIEAAQVDRVVAVATSAVREAKNREEFLALAKRSGYEVEVISGEEEARRTMLGIRSGLPAGISRVLGLDIGGGSTEFILDRPGVGPKLYSLQLGVVRLAERELRHDPPTEREVAAARASIRDELERLRPELGDLTGTTLVGTAGTITTLAAMALELPTYQPTRIHNFRLEMETVRLLEQRVLSRSVAERKGMPGLEAGREEVIAAGTLILHGAMEAFGFASCLVSDLGLREGILIDLASRLRQQSSS